ncbi:hypothetical protein [Sulfurimonas sp.]|nr:hypothetical protein [Sulfurimonas sp.]MCW8895006.1 hypothetical protein [Sulfurimonas sp.]
MNVITTSSINIKAKYISKYDEVVNYKQLIKKGEHEAMSSLNYS